jgi:Encapsulating protein for peroxidase
MDYLNRGAAPFGDDIWKQIDEAAVNAACDMLTGRRFLEVEGPVGVGLTSVEVGNDDFCRQPGPEEAGAILGRAISAPMGFTRHLSKMACWSIRAWGVCSSARI